MVIEGGAATEVEGTFRVNGSNKRMRELQAAFESPPRVRPDSSHFTPSFLITHSAPHFGSTPFSTSGSTTLNIVTPPLDTYLEQYGKSLEWTKEQYTTHDVASVFRRYLTQMPVCLEALSRLSSLPIADNIQESVIPHDMYHLVSLSTPSCRDNS